MRIEKPTDLHLLTYFPLSQERVVEKGRSVDISFETGETISGRIRKVYPVTALYRAERLHRQQFQEPRLVAEVVPTGTELANRVLSTEATVYVQRGWVSRLPGL